MISQRKSQNIVVAIYEGIILENKTSYDIKPIFGRSIYCNYEKSYYVGYSNYGQEKHGKGIYFRKNTIHN
jgi:hypothetical protein